MNRVFSPVRNRVHSCNFQLVRGSNETVLAAPKEEEDDLLVVVGVLRINPLLFQNFPLRTSPIAWGKSSTSGMIIKQGTNLGSLWMIALREAQDDVSRGAVINRKYTRTFC